MESEGFIFYTNYISRKGKDLAVNHPYAYLLFFRREKEQQIMVVGIVKKTTSEKSTVYINVWLIPLIMKAGQRKSLPPEYHNGVTYLYIYSGGKLFISLLFSSFWQKPQQEGVSYLYKKC